MARITEAILGQGHRLNTLPTTGPGTGVALARRSLEAGADLILALGGDGTLNEIANGMIGTHVPLAVLPAGTANVLARELGLGCNTLAVVSRLSECMPRRISVGLLQSDGGRTRRHFLLMAGVGFDAHIVYRLNLNLKSRMGQLAYWLGALKELGRVLDEFETHTGGRSFRCTFALASRVRNYAGYLKLARHASLLDQDFEMMIFEGSTLRYYSVYLSAVLSGRTGRTRGITSLRAPGASFAAPPGSPVYVQVDGEYAGRLPASVEIVPDALTILAPPEFCTGL